MWQYGLVLIVALVLTLQSLFAKLYSNHYTGEESFSSPVFSVLYGFVVALATLAANGLSYEPSGLTLALGILNGLFLFLYNFALIEGSRRGSFSFVMICNLFGGVLVVMATMFFLPHAVEWLWGRGSFLWFEPQSFTLIQGVALIVVLVAFVLLNLKGENQRKPGKLYYLFALLLGIVNGGYATVLALQSALRPDDRAEVLITTFFFGGLFSLVQLLISGKKRFFSLFRMPPKAWGFAVGACLIAALAANLLTVVLGLFENAAIVNSTINGGILIFSALSSRILFGERMNKIQWIGAILCVISLVLLNF